MRIYARTIRIRIKFHRAQTERMPIVQSFSRSIRSGTLSVVQPFVITERESHTKPLFLSIYAHLCTLCINSKHGQIEDKDGANFGLPPPFSSARNIAANQSRKHTRIIRVHIHARLSSVVLVRCSVVQ